ncbi:hypothetical protein WI666_17925, partial [Vibrio cholerae]
PQLNTHHIPEKKKKKKTRRWEGWDPTPIQLHPPPSKYNNNQLQYSQKAELHITSQCQPTRKAGGDHTPPPKKKKKARQKKKKKIAVRMPCTHGREGRWA